MGHYATLKTHRSKSEIKAERQTDTLQERHMKREAHCKKDTLKETHMKERHIKREAH